MKRKRTLIVLLLTVLLVPGCLPYEEDYEAI
jgi:hypothetical protein